MTAPELLTELERRGVTATLPALTALSGESAPEAQQEAQQGRNRGATEAQQAAGAASDGSGEPWSLEAAYTLLAQVLEAEAAGPALAGAERMKWRDLERALDARWEARDMAGLREAAGRCLDFLGWVI